MGYLSPAELLYLLLGRAGPLRQHHPGHQLFPVFFIGDPDHIDIGNLRMVVEELLDLAGIDILPAPDHHVLQPPDNLDVSLFIHRPQIPGMVPPVGIKGGMGSARVVVVAFHDAVSTGADLADLSTRHDLPALRVDDLQFGVGKYPSDG